MLAGGSLIGQKGRDGSCFPGAGWPLHHGMGDPSRSKAQLMLSFQAFRRL